jgi:hypothetical protein
MVIAKSSRGSKGRRKLGFVSALVAPLAFSLACGKLVGVEDTVVATGGADSETGGASAKGGNSSTGGTASATGGSSTTGGSGGGTTGGMASGTGGKAASQGGTTSSGGTSSEGGDVSDAGEGPGGAPTLTGGTNSGGTTGGKGGGASTGGKGGASTGGTSTGGTTGGSGGKGGAGGTTGGAATGGSGGACSPACTLDKPVCDAGQCVNRGPTMVKMSNYWIDSTEVTVAHYKKFLEAKGTDTSGQPAVCSWNTTYYDDANPMFPDNYPMSYVDWCDATAFCAWSGKRLCGKIGGGPIARADIFTSNMSQWFLACGGPNGSSHPSGTSTCNNSGSIAAVGTYKCEGFYPGLFDLEGNVAEWVDGCAGNTGKDDVCYLMGGGVFDQKSYCTEVYEDTDDKRSSTAVSFGFRCCSG